MKRVSSHVAYPVPDSVVAGEMVIELTPAAAQEVSALGARLVRCSPPDIAQWVEAARVRPRPREFIVLLVAARAARVLVLELAVFNANRNDHSFPQLLLNASRFAELRTPRHAPAVPHPRARYIDASDALEVAAGTTRASASISRATDGDEQGWFPRGRKLPSKAASAVGLAASDEFDDPSRLSMPPLQ